MFIKTLHEFSVCIWVLLYSLYFLVDGKEFIESYQQPFSRKLLKWSCEDECRYDCMWKTVDAYEKRKWRVPQFFGKVTRFESVFG